MTRGGTARARYSGMSHTTETRSFRGEFATYEYTADDRGVYTVTAYRDGDAEVLYEGTDRVAAGDLYLDLQT